MSSFESTLFKAADKLRKNMDAAEYKHIVLGLIFLKYISGSFEELHEKLQEGKGDFAHANPEDPDEYLAHNVFFVPPEARWSTLLSQAKHAGIGEALDTAMEAIERLNPTLKDILPKVYAKPNLDKAALGQLIDLIGDMGLKENQSDVKDLLGRVYEYFLGEFANNEGKKGGQFYTPKSIVTLMTAMLEPYKGRVYDPCCGSGGMFVMSEKFVEEHQGRIDDIAIYGQESNQTTWKLCRMNLAIRGIDGSNVRWNTEGSFLKDAHLDLKADYILANPPFNDSDWSGDLLREDPRWQYGVPPAGNANYAWMQHMLYHLAPHGRMALVLSNGSLSSNQSGEGEIRQRIVENDLVDCIVMLPKQLFYNTGISACLWFLTRDKARTGERNRKGETLFIDASEKGFMEDRAHRKFSDAEIAEIADTYHKWRLPDNAYKDVKGFCKSENIEAIAKHNFVLTPNNFVGVPPQNNDGIPFVTNMKIMNTYLRENTVNSDDLNHKISAELNKYFSDYNWTEIEFNSHEILEKLAQAIFNEWLIEFNFPNKDGKPYKINSGSMIDTDQGKIPNGWTKKSLSEIAVFLNGLAMQKFPQHGPDYLPVIKIREINSGISAQTDRASMDVPEEYIVHNGDVLFSWSGSLELVIWHGGVGALNQHLFKVTSEVYPKWFYYFWTKHYLPKFRAIANSKATTMGHIQRRHLDEAFVNVPSKDSLEVFNRFFEPIFNKWNADLLQPQSFNLLRNSLLQDLCQNEISTNQN